MVISTISLKSFRSFLDVEIPLDAPRVFFAGLNGVGKSTIREAIRYVLTGRAQGLDGKGSGSELLVPTTNGSKTVSAAVTIQGIGQVERTWSVSGSSLRVQGFTGDSRSQQAALLEKLQTTDAFLQACLDSRLFLQLHHAEAKALVLQLLNVRIKLGEEDDAPVYSLAEVDEMYDQAFEDRKVAKLKLKAHQIPPKPSDESHAKVADIDATLTKRRQALEEAVAGVGSVAGQRTTLLRRKAQLSQPIVTVTDHELARVAEAIADLEERLGIMDEASEERPLSPPEPGIGLAGRLQFLRDRIEALELHKPKSGCVLYADVPCETAKIKFTNVVKELKAEINSLPEPDVTADPPLVDPRAGLRAELDRLRRIQRSHQQDVDTEARRVKELAAVSFELDDLPDTSAQEAVIADLRDRIQKGMAIKQAAEVHWRAVAAYDQAVEAGRALTADVERLEALVAVLGPQGVRLQALGSAMGAFEAAVNEFTKPYGMTVQFVLDPWGVNVNDRPVETYSNSERYRIGIAIQLAVAQLSGLQFAVVDELDILDQRNRDLLALMLLNAPLEQILLLGTREATHVLPTVPQIPGHMVAYRLAQDEGRSVVIERAAV